MSALSKSNDSFGKSAGGLGDQIKELSGKLGVQLPEGATKALNGMNGFSAGTVAAMSAAAAGVAAFIKVVKELHDITMQAAHDADELVTKSMVTGLSTDTLQQWQYASEFIDVSVETMTGSMTKLTRAMYDAETGNKAAAEAFAALGVNITDSSGQLRSAEDVFLEVVDALGEVGTQTERDALAMEIMGKSAQELNPLILQGSDALRDLAAQAEETGYVLDESQIQKLAEVDDAYQKTQLQIEATKKQLAVEFAPASKQAMETFGQAVEKASQMLIDSGLIDSIANVVQGVLNIISSVTKFADAVPNWLNPINNLSAQFRGLAMVLAMISDYMDAVNSLLHFDFNGVKTALGWNVSSGQLNNRQQLKYGNSGWTYNSEIGAWNASGNENWRGGLTWVGEAGPELVSLPRGSQIYSNQESRGMTGGNVYNITVANIDELNQLLAWFDGLQIMGRMG